MTLPSRRKRPTTPQNILPRNAERRRPVLLLTIAGWLVAATLPSISAQEFPSGDSSGKTTFDNNFPPVTWSADDEWSANRPLADVQPISGDRDELRELIERQRIALGNRRFQAPDRDDDDATDDDERNMADDEDMDDEFGFDDDIANDEADKHTVTSRDRRISEIRPSLDYAWGDIAADDLPDDFDDQTEDSYFAPPLVNQLIFQWRPTDLWYNPIYFEDPTLERYGHTYHPVVQPVVSTGRFVGQAVMFPYQATLRPVRSREYPLGYYRPGECAPKLTYQLPFNEEAAVTETLAVMGLFFLIP